MMTQEKIHTFIVFLNFVPNNEIYDVAVCNFSISIATQSIQNYNPENGFSYKVTGKREALGNRLAMSVFIERDNSWTSLTASYIVSSSL